MPAGLNYVDLDIYTTGDDVHETQKARVSTVEEDGTNIKKIAFEIVNDDGSVVATKKVAYQAIAVAIGIFE